MPAPGHSASPQLIAHGVRQTPVHPSLAQISSCEHLPSSRAIGLTYETQHPIPVAAEACRPRILLTNATAHVQCPQAWTLASSTPLSCTEDPATWRHLEAWMQAGCSSTSHHKMVYQPRVEATVSAFSGVLCES